MTGPHAPTTRRRAALLLASGMAALALTACGDDGGYGGTGTPSPGATTSAAPAAGRHNDADVAFAQDMIVHHRQAVTMSGMAEGRGASPAVQDLARKIEKAQAPEIATMSGWLKAWGEEVPEGTDMEHGHDMDASPMPGMMDEDRMDALRRASGKAFDTMFLTMMIEHHKGAVAMAGTEKKDGVNEQAKQLADRITTTQNAEIAQMEKMLGKGRT
ncbi:DUF305 domain-containing protein [Streptomyces coeruleoprunus]|uniref:DUF305 domain-containing protein n=1 Tax=Streptomyces coeruleoprunus TaxID=285563 RepID=A0ABV9X7L2_9ACTN